MASAVNIIEDILDALKSIQGKSSRDLTKGDAFMLPRLIPAGDGGGTIQITKQIDDLITSLASELKAAQSALTRTVKDDEWRVWVRTSVGPLLAGEDLSISAGTVAPGLLVKLNEALGDVLSSLSGREYSVGTTLFSNGDVAPFTIGPVTFEPRALWLNRKAAEGDVTSVTQARIHQHWTGSSPSNKQFNLEQMREDGILSAVGTCPYVVTVKLSAVFAPDAGLETALTTARLGLACVAILFESPTDLLKGFNLKYDGPIHNQTALVFTPGKITIPGSRLSRRPHGPFVSPQDWLAEMARQADVFSACGEILDNLVDPARTNSRAQLLDALLQSLIWFEKGCREPGDLMAIVAFAASLDALGKGTKAKGILKVLKARLGISPTDQINPHGPTYQAVLDDIYSDGRSRTIHGTSQKIGFDWGATRGMAEQIARYALISCLDYAAVTPAAAATDDLKQ